MCNTESNLRCVLIGSKLAGLLTAKCWLSSGFQIIHTITRPFAWYRIDNRSYPMEMVSSFSSSANNDDYDDEPLLKKLYGLLCIPQNVPECASEHLKLSKFPGGACPQTPPVNNYKNCAGCTFSKDPSLWSVIRNWRVGKPVGQLLAWSRAAGVCPKPRLQTISV